MGTEALCEVVSRIHLKREVIAAVSNKNIFHMLQVIALIASIFHMLQVHRWCWSAILCE